MFVFLFTCLLRYLRRFNIMDANMKAQIIDKMQTFEKAVNEQQTIPSQQQQKVNEYEAQHKQNASQIRRNWRNNVANL